MRTIALAVTGGALALALGACGGGLETSTETAGSETDRAFVAGMVPHHEQAVEMAEIAQKRGESDFVKELAVDIINTQTEEIATLEEADEELSATGVEVGDLGVPEHMTGMSEDVSSLRDAEPFDRAFVDMMIPHHQGAIVMARAEIARGGNDELKQLAEAIIAAQSREIEQMNQFRGEEFDEPSPAGGVPPVNGAAPPGEHPGEKHE